MLVPVLVGMAVSVAAMDRDSGLRTWFRLRGDLEAAEERIARLQALNFRLKAEVEAFGRGPFAEERAIREELGLARPGETVIRFVRPGGSEGGVP